MNWRTNENFKTALVNSKYFYVYRNKLRLLLRGDLVKYKESYILEPWIEIYDNNNNFHIGTIPKDIFLREFKTNIVEGL